MEFDDLKEIKKNYFPSHSYNDIIKALNTMAKIQDCDTVAFLELFFEGMKWQKKKVNELKKKKCGESK